MESTERISVRMVNIIGQTVREIDLGKMNAGTHLVSLDLTGLPSGIYTCSVEAGGKQVSRKMMIR
ncbi:MAG: T9SS type A sorting domain-containing protein [Bacteroidales bacterium]|nr:T9SS type A sorting domain-containing protein [Bacteroidales bacterium]